MVIYVLPPRIKLRFIRRYQGLYPLTYGTVEFVGLEIAGLEFGGQSRRG